MNTRVEDEVFSHPERSGREGNAGRGPEEDGLPWLDVATLEHQVREDHTRAAVEAE